MAFVELVKSRAKQILAGDSLAVNRVQLCSIPRVLVTVRINFLFNQPPGAQKSHLISRLFNAASTAKDDVVPSPWKCWSCAGGSEHWQHPKTPLHLTEPKNDRPRQTVFVASDDLCEVFYHGVAVEHTKDTVTIAWPEWPDAPPTRYSLTDNRLWRGNHFRNSWKKDDKDCSLRPISRMYAFAQKKNEEVKDEQQQQQQETKKRKEPSPSSTAPPLPPKSPSKNKKEAAAEEKQQAKKKSSGSSNVAAAGAAAAAAVGGVKEKQRSNAINATTISKNGQQQKHQVVAKTTPTEPLPHQVLADTTSNDIVAVAAVEEGKMSPAPTEVGSDGCGDDAAAATHEPAGRGSGGDGSVDSIPPKVPHSDENASQNQLIMGDVGLPSAVVDISIDDVHVTIDILPVEERQLQQHHRVKGKEVEGAQPPPPSLPPPPQATVASPSPAAPTSISVGDIEIFLPSQRNKNKPNLPIIGGVTTITSAALNKNATTNTGKLGKAPPKLPVLSKVLPRKEPRQGPLYQPPTTTTSKTAAPPPDEKDLVLAASYGRVTKDSSLTDQERKESIVGTKNSHFSQQSKLNTPASPMNVAVGGDDLRVEVEGRQGDLERSRLAPHPIAVAHQQPLPPPRRKAATLSTYQHSQRRQHQQEQALIAEAAGVLNNLATTPVGPPPLSSTPPSWSHLRATSAARSLTLGSEVEIRWLDHDCGLRGAWFAATILEVAAGVSVAPHFTFYRVECVDLTSDGDHAVREWLPIAVPAPWDSDELAVQVRIPATTTAERMAMKGRSQSGGYDGRRGGGDGIAPSVWSTSWSDLRVGQRVEASWDDAWWMGRISSIEWSHQSKTGLEIEVEFDAPPVGEGGPKVKFDEEDKVRPAHPWGEENWFGMLEPDTNSIHSGNGGMGGIAAGALQQGIPSHVMKPEDPPTLAQCFATALGLLDMNTTNKNGTAGVIPVPVPGTVPETKNLPLADAAARFSELLSFVNANVLKQAEERARQIDVMEAQTQARFERLRRIDEGLNARANYLNQQEQQQQWRERERRVGRPRGDPNMARKRKYGKDNGGEELEWNAEREVYYRPEKSEPKNNNKKQRFEQGADFKECTKSEDYKCGRPAGHDGLCWSHKTASLDSNSNTVPKDTTAGNWSASQRGPRPRPSPPLPRQKKVQQQHHERHRSTAADRHISSSSRAPPQYEDLRRGGPWHSEDLRERRGPSPPDVDRRRAPPPPFEDLRKAIPQPHAGLVTSREAPNKGGGGYGDRNGGAGRPSLFEQHTGVPFLPSHVHQQQQQQQHGGSVVVSQENPSLPVSVVPPPTSVVAFPFPSSLTPSSEQQHVTFSATVDISGLPVDEKLFEGGGNPKP